MDQIEVRLAGPHDVPGITACVCEAYLPYVERIGRQPGPMVDDYMDVLRHCRVYVAVQGRSVAGVVVLVKTIEGLCLDSVAVRPALQGRGIGRCLIEHAELEAMRQGFDSLYGSAHEGLGEGISACRHLGYHEYERRVDCGNAQIYFRKVLTRAWQSYALN